MKDVERMFKMSDNDRGLFQRIQEGLTGSRPIDSTWIDEIIQALKAKPEVFKSLFKGAGAHPELAQQGLSGDQIEGFIDMASKMDVWLLKLIGYGIWNLSKLAKPAMELYKTVDNYTFGAARYLLLALFAFVMYFVSMGVVYVLRIVFTFLYAWGLYAYHTINGTTPVVATSTVSNMMGAANGASKSAVGVVLENVATSAATTAATGAAATAAGAAAKLAQQQQQAVGVDNSNEDEFEF
jgi:hypothetical protein